jgi:hypothetical protein
VEAYALNNRTSIVRHRISKQAFSKLETLCFLRGPCREVIKGEGKYHPCYPCAGGVEYFHRDPASLRWRRKGKSQVSYIKVWSQVPSDSNPRKTALARASSIYKRQTHPLVREGALQKQGRNSQTIINIWSWAPAGTRHQDLLIDRPSVAM